MSAQQAYLRKNVWAQRTGTAVLLANELRELTLSLPMHDPITPDTMGPEADEGSLVQGANQPVSFDAIESIGPFMGVTSTTINGTNGPDTLTLIARDNSFTGVPMSGAGVQDFTISVNGGLDLLYLDTPSVTLNGLAGSDEFVVRTPAPNGAVWDVDVTINGGTPSADGDQLMGLMRCWFRPPG